MARDKVPRAQLAEQAGIVPPLRRAFTEILGVLLGVNAWKCGPLRSDMDPVGAADAVKRRMPG